MSGGARFDDRFEQNAAALAVGRPTYPAELFQRISEYLGGARVRVALDLGCGAGQSMDGLFGLAQEVRGVEPGERLRKLAALRHPAARISPGTGEATEQQADSIQLVTVGTALTWMDTPVVLREVHRILAQEGVLAIYAYGFPVLEGPANDLLQQELHTAWDPHRSPRLQHAEDVTLELRESGLYSGIEEVLVPNPIDMSVVTFVDFLRSASFVRAFLETLQEPQRYLEQLERRFIENCGQVARVRFDVQLHIARRL